MSLYCTRAVMILLFKWHKCNFYFTAIFAQSLIYKILCRILFKDYTSFIPFSISMPSYLCKSRTFDFSLCSPNFFSFILLPGAIIDGESKLKCFECQPCSMYHASCLCKLSHSTFMTILAGYKLLFQCHK